MLNPNIKFYMLNPIGVPPVVFSCKKKTDHSLFFSKSLFLGKRVVVAITSVTAMVYFSKLSMISLICLGVLSLLELAYRCIFLRKNISKPSFSLPEKFFPIIEKLFEGHQWNMLANDRYFALSNVEERTILNYLDTHFEITPEIRHEICSGAYVCLEDEGRAYETWVNLLANKYSRRSSHHSKGGQFSIRGQLVSELLFGKHGKISWFQLEKSPLMFGYLTCHFYDFLIHLLLGKNVGPKGVSSYTESNPLILKPNIELVSFEVFT